MIDESKVKNAKSAVHKALRMLAGGKCQVCGARCGSSRNGKQAELYKGQLTFPATAKTADARLAWLQSRVVDVSVITLDPPCPAGDFKVCRKCVVGC